MPGVQLILELESGEPIRGWLARADGPRQEFAGLLELVAALDRLRLGGPGGTVPEADVDGAAP